MIRVLIAEDIEPVLRRYGRILGTDPEIEVIAQVQTGEEAAREALLLHPDVILMDVEMETRTAGLDASRTILSQASPTPKIIILTVYEDDETVFEAFRLGVTDYVLKNSAPGRTDRLCARDAYLNRSPIRPAIARKIRDEFQRIKKQEDSLLYCIQIVSQLTQTELDILTMMSRGYTRSQICEIRCVELSTVKSQIHTILKKFGKNNMQEAHRHAEPSARAGSICTCKRIMYSSPAFRSEPLYILSYQVYFCVLTYLLIPKFCCVSLRAVLCNPHLEFSWLTSDRSVCAQKTKHFFSDLK